MSPVTDDNEVNTEQVKDFNNPLVAGFGTATADKPPLPAKQHLDATGGYKVEPPREVREGDGTPHEVQSDGEHIEDDDDGAEDYEAQSHADLQAEIDRRNESRDEADRITRSGSKKDLAQRLRDDDEQE